MTARSSRHPAAARRFAGVFTALALAAPAMAPAQAPVTDSSSLAARLERLERSMNSGTLVELLERVEALSREIRDLRGQVELQGHEIGQLKQSQRELYLDLDGRLQRLEGGGAAPPVVGGGGSPDAAPAGAEPAQAAPGQPPVETAGTQPPASATAPATPSGPTVDPLAEQAQYQAAFNLLKEARYDAAAKALKDFLQAYPNGSFADNAQYWLGESYYVTRKFPDALAEFQTLVTKFPSSQKYTHALLKIGYIHDELGNQADARRVLDDLVSRYPSSAAAGLAKKRLERLQ